MIFIVQVKPMGAEASPSRTALVVGATGLVGGLLLRRLLDAGRHASVAAAVRRPLGFAHPRLKEVLVDFEQAEPGAWPAADDAFCCLGTTRARAGSPEAFRRVDFDYALASARLSLERGASQFLLVTAVGADPGSPFLYPRTKGELEAAVSALPFKAVHIFRPSMLLGERLERRRAERAGQALMKAAAPLMLGPLRKYRPIEARDLAWALAEQAARGLSGVHVLESDAVQELFDSLPPGQKS